MKTYLVICAAMLCCLSAISAAHAQEDAAMQRALERVLERQLRDPAPAAAPDMAAPAPTATMPVPLPIDEKPEPARNHAVTSLKKCLDQLDAEDAAAVRRNYLKPYSECQGRLEAKLQRQQEAKVKAAKTESETPAETPRNYIRVQKAPKDSDKSETKKP